jgi:hypothetical protein
MGCLAIIPRFWQGNVVTNPLLKVVPILPECQLGILPDFPFSALNLDSKGWR